MVRYLPRFDVVKSGQQRAISGSPVVGLKEGSVGGWSEGARSSNAPFPLVGFGTKLSPLSCDSLEAGLDASHGAAGVTRLALQEVQTCVFLQDGVRRATRVTGHIFLNVSSQDILYLFLLKSSLDNKLVISINGATCTKLSQ